MMMEQTKQIQLSLAVEKELEKLPRWKLIMYLQDKGEVTVNSIAQELGWTKSKTHAVVRVLEKGKAVKTIVKLVDNRAVKYIELKG